MAHTSSFRKIDIANWPRKSYYEFFINNHDEGFSITADVDISLLLKQTKAEGLKFYPSFIYATSHVLNKYDDFKLGLHDGELVCWDKIVPSYPIFHDDSKLFSCLWVDYFEDFKKFYLNYLDNTERFKNCTGFMGNQMSQKIVTFFQISLGCLLKISQFSTTMQTTIIFPESSVGNITQLMKKHYCLFPYLFNTQLVMVITSAYFLTKCRNYVIRQIFG